MVPSASTLTHAGRRGRRGPPDFGMRLSAGQPSGREVRLFRRKRAGYHLLNGSFFGFGPVGAGPVTGGRSAVVAGLVGGALPEEVAGATGAALADALAAALAVDSADAALDGSADTALDGSTEGVVSGAAVAATAAD